MENKVVIASDRKIRDTYARAIQQGLELSSGARSSSTYYHSKDEQITAIRAKVEELYKVDKSLPLLLACLDDSTFFFRQEVLRNELSSGAFGGTQAIVAPTIWYDQGMQERMINHIISNLPFTYALRLFVSFADPKTKINNTRTRNKVLSWVFSNLSDFTAVKYHNKIRRALQHAYGTQVFSGIIRNLHRYILDEPHSADQLQNTVFRHTTQDNTKVAKLLLFVARKGRSTWYEGDESFRFINAYYNACNAANEAEFFEHAKLLDYSVVMGIVSKFPNELFESFKLEGKLRDGIKSKLLTNSKVMSDDQKVRTKALQERTGKVRKDVNYDKVQTETLYKTEGIAEQRTKRAKKDRINLPYQRIGVVRDISLSNSGGSDSKNTPAVIIEHLANVLDASASSCVTKKTPVNQTDLSKPLVEILKDSPDVEAIFVLSDGYENYPYEGCFNDLVKKINKTKTLQVIHCSPYVSAEQKARARSLGDAVISMAVNAPAQIQTQMEARLLDFNPKEYFEKQFSKYLEPTPATPTFIPVADEDIL